MCDKEKTALDEQLEKYFVILDDKIIVTGDFTISKFL